MLYVSGIIIFGILIYDEDTTWEKCPLELNLGDLEWGLLRTGLFFFILSQVNKKMLKECQMKHSAVNGP